MIWSKEIPAAFIANNSNRSPKLPKVINDANNIANGKALGTIVTADLAGEIMQGVFLGNIKESDPHSAQGLRFGAGTLVHHIYSSCGIQRLAGS